MLTPRLAISLSFLFCFSATLSAQDAKFFDGPRMSVVISAAAPGDKVRFSSSSADIAQIRVRIVSASGEELFDSAWKDGNVLDWPIEAQGRPLTSGSYRCVVMVKDLAGHVTQKESTLIAQGGQVSLEHRAGTDGLTIVGLDEGTPKITVLVHDGDNGAIVSTSGGLSFRLGNFLAGKDREAMRLTAEGSLGIGTDKPQAPLDVNGLIRTSKGIMFSDGTILTTAGGTAVTVSGGVNRLNANAPGSTTAGPILGIQPGASSSRPTPRANSTPPSAQFVVDSNGVHIGTTPTFGLDVTGNVKITGLGSVLRFPDGTAQSTAGITAIMPGPGIVVTGAATPTVGIDSAQVQSRITAKCADGGGFLAVNQDGSVTCSGLGRMDVVEAGTMQFTVPPGVAYLVIEAWSGGGSGSAGFGLYSGSGGGAGGYARVLIPANAGTGGTFTVTAGHPGKPTTGVTGEDGGDTTIAVPAGNLTGTLLSVAGGAGGSGVSGGAGGSVGFVSKGVVLLQSSAGGNGAPGTFLGAPGAGGASPFGATPGSGGAGCLSGGTSTLGLPGLVLITYH